MKKAMSDGLKGATQVGAGLSLALVLIAGVAAPSMAEDLGQDLGVIRACGGDVWRLCKDVLPDVGRIKACVQDKMGQLSKGCVDKLLDSMAGGSFKICKNQTYALCAVARYNVFDGVAYCQCDVKRRPVPAARRVIKSWGPILATSPSSGTAKATPPTARRVRRSMSALQLERLRLWRSCSTAVSRPSTSAGSSKAQPTQVGALHIR